MSLFTGKTLADDRNARDGSRSEPGSRPLPSGPPPLRWHADGGGLGMWTESTRGYRIDVRDGVYVLSRGGQRLGRHATLIAASRAADDDARGSR